MITPKLAAWLNKLSLISTKESSTPMSTTPEDHPKLLPCDKTLSLVPSCQCMTVQRFHLYYGFRTLKNWPLGNEVAQDTVDVCLNTDKSILELGDVANIWQSQWNESPMIAHMRFVMWFTWTLASNAPTALLLKTVIMVCSSLIYQNLHISLLRQNF